MFISLDSTKIYYIKKGKGKPLVFLHGVLLDTGAFSEFIDILSDYYTVFAIDLPMHGRSGNSKKVLSLGDLSDLIKFFISKLKIKNPVICGFSAGGLVALYYASKNKSKELVLLDPAGAKDPSSRLSAVWRIVFLMTFRNFFINPLKSFDIIRNGFFNIARNIFNRKFWVLSDEFLKKDYFKEMRMIKCRTTILWAKHDEVIPFRNHSIFLSMIKNSKLVEVDGNHSWPNLKPKEILKYVNF